MEFDPNFAYILWPIYVNNYKFFFCYVMKSSGPCGLLVVRH
jgi:hypothetical protein